MDFEARFFESLRALEPKDALRLCFSPPSPGIERLRRFRTHFEAHTAPQEQLGLLLILFDLARRGDKPGQSAFINLADLLANQGSFAEKGSQLTEGHSELESIWRDCQKLLESIDERFGPQHEEASVDALTGVQTVDGQEFIPEEGTPSEETLRLYAYALQDFFEDDFMRPTPVPAGGFRVDSKRDVQRFERFITEMSGLADKLPEARIFRAWALLFYGTHLRSYGLFGRINGRKRTIIREGLREFTLLAPGIWQVAPMFETAYCEPQAWEKVTELLADYAAWIAQGPYAPDAGTEIYEPIERLEQLYRERADIERRRGYRGS